MKDAGDEKQRRIELFREKIKSLSREELIALSMLMRRGTLDLVEESAVLKEHLNERKEQERINRSSNA